MEELKIKLVFDIIRKDRALFIKIFFSIFILLFIVTLFLKPKYPISSSIIVEEKDNSMSASSITMLMSNQSQKIQNEIEIFKSRAILDEVIENLNLSYNIKRKNNYFLNYIMKVLSGSPSFEGSLLAESVPDKLKKISSEITVTKTGYNITNSLGEKECLFSTPCECFDGSLILNKLGRITPGTVFEAKYINIVKRRAMLFGKMSFVTIGDTKDSNVFQIVYTTPEPMIGVKIIEEFDKKYIEKKLEWNSDDANNQKKFMGKMLDNVKKELDEKSAKLALYQKENMTVLPDLQFTEIMKRNVEIEKDIAILRLQEEIVNKYNQSIDVDEISALPAPIVIDDASVQMTVKSHNELIAEYNALSNNFTDDHPLVEKTKSDLKLARKNLKDLLKKCSNNYQKSIAILKNQSTLISSTIEDLPKNLMNIADLQREVLITEKLYAFLAQKIYEAQITQTVEIAPIRIMDKPTHLIKKSFPSFSISIVFITFLSIFISLFIFFAIELKRKKVFSHFEIFSEKSDLIYGSVKKPIIMSYISDFISTFVNPPDIVTIFDSTGDCFDIDKLNLSKKGHHYHIFIADRMDESAPDKNGIELLESLTGTPINSYSSCYRLNFDDSSVSNFFQSDIFSKKLSEMLSGSNIILLVLKNFSPDCFSKNFIKERSNVLFAVKTNKTDRAFARSIQNSLGVVGGNKKILIEK